MKTFKSFITEIKKPTGDLKKACWTGYTAVGTKEKNGRTVPNCVPEEVQVGNPNCSCVKELEKDLKHLDSHDYETINKLMSRLSKSHNMTGKELHNNFMSKHGETPDDWIKQQIKESAAWQRKEGKNPEGGLNQKGVDSYRRENPGSKLKTAVTTKPSKLKAGSAAANRRKSFCARMSGMKKRLTSSKTANDPDSRINKSLRKWNC